MKRRTWLTIVLLSCGLAGRSGTGLATPEGNPPKQVVNLSEKLTAAIAVAAIVTAVAAIWTAWETRRYSKETKDLVGETRRSIEAQRQEWTRSLHIELNLRFEDRWESVAMRQFRRDLARRFKGIEKWSTEQRAKFYEVVEELPTEIMSFFESLGFLDRLG